jgi:peptidoglycan/LPS O-acetylase OafA/YrhL
MFVGLTNRYLRASASRCPMDDPVTATPSPNRADHWLPELQGLRALAVGLVLVFHLWPQALPGGYVGVDVFFVISGFLITRLLYRELAGTGRIRMVPFYARRSRRLLPAASLVLVVVLLATLVWLPPALRADTVWEVIYSALYVENWRLAWLSIDYLGAENAASPVQHFWSLSIEEQFYIVWPALMLLSARFPSGWPTRARLLATLGLVTAGSFGCGVYLSSTDPASAYFTTHTRVWELGVGAILALLPARRIAGRRAAEALRIGGLCAIVASAVVFSSATAWPGAFALVPALGTAAIIAASAAPSAGIAARALASRPMQYLGDLSYSLYLWHWAFIVFYLTLRPGPIRFLEGLLLAGLSLFAAATTKVLVEDRFRGRSRRTGIGLAGGTAAMGIVVALSLAIVLPLEAQLDREALIVARDYPGPLALLGGATTPAGVPPLPDPAVVKRDLPETYDNGCHQSGVEPELVECSYGDPRGDTMVFLVGDSHAAQWQPALDFAARQLGWSLRTFTKSGCGFYSVRLTRDGGPNLSCEAWGTALLRAIAERRPDLVVWAGYRGARVWLEAEGRPGDATATASALAATWSEIRRLGSDVLVILDTPLWPSDPSGCLATPATCVLQRPGAPEPDPARLAVEGGGVAVTVLDPTDMFCDPETCRAIVGNVVVWRDVHHMTATYSAMLGPEIAARLATLTSPSR